MFLKTTPENLSLSKDQSKNIFPGFFSLNKFCIVKFPECVLIRSKMAMIHAFSRRSHSRFKVWVSSEKHASEKRSQIYLIACSFVCAFRHHKNGNPSTRPKRSHKKGNRCTYQDTSDITRPRIKSKTDLLSWFSCAPSLK